MRHTGLGIMTLGALVTLSGAAVADHNSKWGEGTANMPNDIHNTRIETRGDNDSFREFVQYGEGADSVNRYATDTDDGEPGVAARTQGDDAAAKRSGARGADKSSAAAGDARQEATRNRTETRDMTRARTEARELKRTRIEKRPEMGSRGAASRGAGGRGR
jgi:hypothetical protein